MKKTLERLMSGATRLLVLALGLGLTATGWATVSLEESGAVVPTTETLAFKGVTLSQLTAETLSGVGANNIDGKAITFCYFDRTNEGSGSISCQAQAQDGGSVKSALLTFTQSGNDVNVKKTAGQYISGTVGEVSVLDEGYGTEISGYPYNVRNLKLNISKPTPIAVFDGASGGFLKTSVNGVTFASNGNTVAEDGSYVKISAAVGALFKLSSGYNYVVGEFTVTNLNESAAADRVLALWSAATDGTGSTVGTYLTSGTVSTSGIWTNDKWDNKGVEGTLKSGVSTDTARTFVLTTEDSKVNNVQNDTGTHLFELTGENPGTAVYGGANTMGLRGDQEYKTLAIGGPATGSLSAMTDLVITKVVIYASNGTRQFTSTATTTITDIDNPAALYVGNGETITASSINAKVTASGSAYVCTEAGATLNLNAELVGRKIYFTGSISGVVGTADGLTLGSENDKVTLSDKSYVPVLKGCGTIVYPDNTIPDANTTCFTASDWAGTVSLSNIQGDNNTKPGWYTPFHNYGSSNSTIKVAGFAGFFAAGNHESYATLEIVAGSTFTLNNGNNGNSMTFAKLTGSGDIVICGDNSPAIQYVMRDASEFAGNIRVSQSGSSTFKKSIVLGGGSSYNYNTGKYQKQICVLGNVTIASGKTWSADSGIVVSGNGVLTLADNTSTMGSSVSGDGKIVCNDKLPNNDGLAANTWTGTVEVNGGATTAAGIAAANAQQFMNSGSAFTVASGTVMLGTAAGLTGTVNVNSGATLQVVDNSTTSLSLSGANKGNVNLVACSALTTLTLSDGMARGTVVYPNSLTILNVALSETLADDGEYSISCGSATPTSATLTLTRADGAAAEPISGTISGSTVSFAWTPSVSGAVCWCAYEFETSGSTALKNTGSDTTGLSADGSFSAATSVDGNGRLYTYSHPWRNITYPEDGNWSAMVRCTVPKLAEALVVAFGTKAAGMIGLAAGATPDTEMRVVQGISTDKDHYLTNGVMSVVNGTTAQHVYVFTVEGNQHVKVYCDGSLINSVDFESQFTIGDGIQVGTVHGGLAYGLHACRSDTNPDAAYAELSEEDQKAARVDSMRLYKATLGPNAIAQLSTEFPAVKLFEATIDGGNDNEWATLGWTGGDISTLNAYSTIRLTVTDDATLTLPSSITADEFYINVTSGKTLTLNQGSGVTLDLIHPMEVNGGAIAFTATDIKLGSSVNIGGTGTVKLGNGTIINETLSGTVKVEIASGDTVAVASGGSIANPLTGAGTLTYMYTTVPTSALSFSSWTGTVQLPAITSGAIIFNNYGTTGSTVYLTSMSSSAWIDPSYTTINPKLYLAGNMTLAAMSTRTYTFAEIDGPGALSFAPGAGEPTVNITKVAEGYSGTISSTLGNPVTIATLDRAAETPVTAGSKLLSTSSGVQASALTLAGVATSISPVFDTDGLYVKAASVTKNDATANYDTVSAAMMAAGNDAATIKLLMPTDSAIALAPGQTLVNGSLTTGGVTGPNGYEVVNNNGTYTLVDNTASTWAPGEESDNSWNTDANWSTGYKPTQYTSVTFPANVDGWTVGIPGNAGNEKCASMTLNGDVTFQRGGGDWAKLCVYGAISGSGTLTLNQTCIENDSGSVITIPGPVAIVGSNDSAFLGANGWTISGNLSVGGYFKTQIPITVTGNAVFAASGAKVETQSAITITGTTTLNGDFSRDTTYGDAQLTFGDVTVAASTAITGAKPTTFSGTITLASGATLTVPTATTTVSGATFATSVADSYVKATEDGSTTIYSVAAKRTVTVSTDAHSSVTGVTNGQKFVPGDVLTITASADTYYTPTLMVNSVAQTSPYQLTTTDADVTVSVTATRDNPAVTAVTFDYYATYATADVTATVTEAGNYTLKVGDNNYNATATEAGSVKFSNVNVSGTELGGNVSYSITQEGASGSYVPTVPETKGTTAASDDWMKWTESEHAANSSWTTNGVANITEIPYSNGEAAFTGTNTYTAAWMSTGEVVTVTTNVKFGDVADPEMTIDANAQAAVRIGAGNVFQVYAGSTPDWVNVYNDELGSPDGDVQYGVTVKLNYSTQTYGVDITKLTATYPLTNATGGAAFPLAKAASAMQQVSYLGAGSFISLSGQYVSAGYTADVGTDGSATNVVVSSDFVNTYMSDKLASEISDLLAPNATKETKPNAIAANGYNYFTSYALGLDPTKEDDKVIVDVTTDDSGKFVFTVKHPVFDGEGNITGYKQVTEAANVTTTVTLKYGTSTDSIATVEAGSAEGISPVDMFNHEGVGNVLYYKAEVTIGAK